MSGTVERLRAESILTILCGILGCFVLLLQTARMLAWDFQPIQRMLPKVLFLWFAPSRVRGEGASRSPLTHHVARVQPANEVQIREKIGQVLSMNLRVPCKNSGTLEQKN